MSEKKYGVNSITIIYYSHPRGAFSTPIGHTAGLLGLHLPHGQPYDWP